MYKNKILFFPSSASHNYNTRGSDNAPVAFQRLTVTQHSIDYEAPHLWNSFQKSETHHPYIYLKRH